MATLIKFILSGVPVWAPILAILLGVGHSLWRKSSYSVNTLRYLLLLVVGVQGLWAGVMHIFFSHFTSAQIGWQPSPFEYEVGMFDFSLGLLGLIAFFRKDFGFWFATVFVTSVFLFGAGIGHIYQLLVHQNYAAFNAGPILYTDILVPLLMVVLLCVSKSKLTNKV